MLPSENELVKIGFKRIKRSSLAKLVRRVERFELKYYRDMLSSRKNILHISREMMEESSDDESESDDEIEISGHESSDLESESELTDEE